MPDTEAKHRYWTPRYWPLWSLFSVLYLITRLPLPAQQAAGRLLGRLLYILAPRRRHIAEVNLRLCFPELAEPEIRQLAKTHFRQFGLSIMESFTAWWTPSYVLEGRAEFEGLQYLQQALAQGKGVLLLGSHFTTLEIGVRLLNGQIPFDMMYRRHKNPLFNQIMCEGRERWGGITLERKDVRGILGSLKAGHAIWYGPDQDYGRKHSVFAPFMGVPAATVTGTSRLAQISGARVVPYFCERLPGGRFKVVVLPALDDFPTDDLEADAQRINTLIEQQIRKAPADYLWTHRRFKTRPEGESRPY